MTIIQASLQHDTAAIRCGHNCWNGAWFWNPTVQIHLLPFRVTIIFSLLEILLTTAMKLQGFACKPQKSLYLHFFIKEFHFVAALSVQLPSENSAKEKLNSLCKYLFLIYYGLTVSSDKTQKVLIEIFHLPNSLKSPGWRLCAHAGLCAKSSIKENIKALQFSHWETFKHSQPLLFAHEMLMGQPCTAGSTDNGSDNSGFVIPITGLQRWGSLPCFIVDDTLSACHVLQVSSGVHYI